MAASKVKRLDSYVALLRGINVGGKNMLPMKMLAAMFGDAGCTEVRTYIQSGNVVFRALPSVVEGLPDRIASEIEAQLGLRVPVVMRSAEEMASVLVRSPFLGEGASLEGKSLYVFFLADLPDASAVAKLDPDRSPPDRYVVNGREIYAHLLNGARSKLTNAYFDSKLKTVSTARNWNTVVKLSEMMKADDDAG